MRVIVVGGGVVGCAISFRLASRGHDVVLLERGRAGDGATAASAGMIAPQAEAERDGPLLGLGLASRALYPDWVAELREISSIDIGFARCGLVLTALDPRQREAQAVRRLWQAEKGLAAEFLDRAALVDLAGPLAAGATEGTYYPAECRVHPRRLAAALAAAAGRLGAVVRSGTRVTSLIGTSQTTTGVMTDGGPEQGDAVVLAAGCWTPGLAPDVSDVPRGTPVRGQIVELEPARPMDGAILYSDVGYLVPRGQRLLFGATTERVGFEARVTAAGVRGLLDNFHRLCPWLADVEFTSASAGLRPESPDGAPTIGASAREGLFIATGHYRNGALLAPVTADIMAELIEQRSPRQELAPFLPGRHATSSRLPAR